MADHHRVDVDDRPLRRLERLGEGVDDPQRTEHGQVQTGSDLLEVGARQRLHRRDRERVVDQHVDPAILVDGGTDERVDLLIGGDIGRYDQRDATRGDDLIGDLCQPRLGARREYNRRAVCRRLPAQCPTQPGTHPGHDNDLVGQQQATHASILFANAR